MAVMPHILLDEKMTAPYALLPGDPARLDRIAAHLDQVEELAYNREFRSLRGFYKGVRVMALSTGLGGPSTAGLAGENGKTRSQSYDTDRKLRCSSEGNPCRGSGACQWNGQK